VVGAASEVLETVASGGAKAASRLTHGGICLEAPAAKGTGRPVRSVGECKSCDKSSLSQVMRRDKALRSPPPQLCSLAHLLDRSSRH